MTEEIFTNLKTEESNDTSDMETKGIPQSEVMPLIAMRGVSLFPSVVLHFDIGRKKSILALERAMMLNQQIFLTTQPNVEIELPTENDFYHVGVVAKVKQMLKLPGDNIRVLVEGLYRAHMDKLVQEVPYFLCVSTKIEDTNDDSNSPDNIALMRMASALFTDYVEKHPKLNKELANNISGISLPGRLADVIASDMEIDADECNKVLSENNVTERLRLVVEILTRENEILAIEAKINRKVKKSMDTAQKEYYLREQMRAIQDELGQGESDEDEINGWKTKLDELNLAPVTRKKVEREISRIGKMASNSPDAAVIRAYVECILELPWNDKTEDMLDLKKAKEILDEDHYGLDKVKERILEYLAVRSLDGSDKGSILCLDGPPGVGKTSIAKSIARAMGREFVHMSLGGVRDEAEIRGHRRTYIGAIPGRVINAIKECGKNNPVFLFDEIDKLGADYKGDPSSALLEVLDPEQNKEFVDHYLEVPFDLSGVMFITTSNTTETIPAPLLDRMEVIELTGYTEEEKLNIAGKYLVPKQLKAHGLNSSQMGITDAAIRGLINYYTRESGVRGLEKEIASLCRKTARKIVEGETAKHTVTISNLEDYLGKKKYHFDKLLGKNEVGVATGLAWTTVGGTTLFVETAVLPGTGQIVLTGQLGDVMQESARTAISFVRSKSSHYGIKQDFYKNRDIHIHVPEGATPKDGPSAGVTMCTSVVSALTGKPVRKNIAMTGEISLRGKVLPVGGIKEKVLAAHRMGITRLLLPEDNKRDLDDLPQVVKDDMEFVLLKKIDEALQEAIVW